MTKAKAECRHCGKSKWRMRHRRRKTGTGFYYVDEKGRFWDGLLCPACKVRKLVVFNRAKRKDRLNELRAGEDGIPTAATPKRVCRKCGDATHNYFLCKACHASMSEDMWDMSASYGVAL